MSGQRVETRRGERADLMAQETRIRESRGTAAPGAVALLGDVERTPLLSIMRCDGSLMFPSRSEMLANARIRRRSTTAMIFANTCACALRHSLAIGPILVLDSDRGGAANQDSTLVIAILRSSTKTRFVARD